MNDGLLSLAKLVGHNIRELRRAQGVTQESLAYEGEAIRSKGYLSDIEAGKRLPSLVALASIAARLGVEPFELLVDTSLPRGAIIAASRDASDAVCAKLLIVLKRGKS